ncbi:MAG: hypothetical protein KTR32_16700 [Granulosicoccus sp.]|nr:hypothetical protein [Granulosicoccus sp.]
MHKICASKFERTRTLSPLALLFTGLFLSTNALAWSWEDLWLTPHQQASRQLENEDYESLTKSENSDWQGVGHSGLGDPAAAAERFAAGESVSSRYNQGTTLTQAGEYDQAIELFDSVLEEQPDHQKAKKNRDIARQLKELQQQQESQNGDTDQQNQDEQQSDQSQDSSPDSQNQDSQNQNSQNQEPQASEDDQNSQSAENTQGEEQSEEQQQTQSEEQAEQDAEEAARQQALSENDVPLTENQQATEQWLRKIPDDPAGLLRRKLRRNHAAEYPNVVNGESPW